MNRIEVLNSGLVSEIAVFIHVDIKVLSPSAAMLQITHVLSEKYMYLYLNSELAHLIMRTKPYMLLL